MAMTIDDAAEEIQSNRAVAVELPPEGSPPLIVLTRRRLSPASLLNLRESLKASMSTGRLVVFDGDLDVFQLIDGRWQPLRGSSRKDDAQPDRRPEVDPQPLG